MRFMSAGAGITGRGILDFLLPPRCLTCDTVTGHKGHGLCGACWSRVRFLEQPWCLRYGTPFEHEVGVDALSPRAIAFPPAFDRARGACWYSGPARDLVLGLKFARRRHLALSMGRWMARAGTELLRDRPLIAPVPLHPRRLLQRRFNQSADLAKVVASLCDSEFVPDLLRRTRHTRAQVGLNATERQKNLRGAIALTPDAGSRVFGRPVLLVDDVMTTGATMAACVKVLKQAGARQIDVLVFAIADPAGMAREHGAELKDKL
ncbi:ComF family protein [Roseibium aquae]|nr:ComF family protein [Roseibium aquae]